MHSVLLITSVASMIKQFNIDNINILKKMDLDVHVAANFKIGNSMPEVEIDKFKKWLTENHVTYHQIDFERGIGSVRGNIRTLRELQHVVNSIDFTFIHCQSPIGGVLGRIIAHKNNIPVIYTAHGFQFIKDGPKKDWIIFYPLEKLLSHWTDCLITINYDDYGIAKNKFSAEQTEYIPGVGIDVQKIIEHDDNTKIREELGLREDDILITSAGELNDNKNHIIVLQALAKINNKKNIYYVICGKGKNVSILTEEATKLGISDHFFVLGYRTDLLDIMKGSDLFVFPSKREGLSVALMEALASETPVVASRIRGNIDLIESGVNGWLFTNNSESDLLEKIQIALHSDQIDEIILNQIKMIKKFDISDVHSKMNESVKFYV